MDTADKIALVKREPTEEIVREEELHSLFQTFHHQKPAPAFQTATDDVGSFQVCKLAFYLISY